MQTDFTGGPPAQAGGVIMGLKDAQGRSLAKCGICLEPPFGHGCTNPDHLPPPPPAATKPPPLPKAPEQAPPKPRPDRGGKIYTPEPPVPKPPGPVVELLTEIRDLLRILAKVT